VLDAWVLGVVDVLSLVGSSGCMHGLRMDQLEETNYFLSTREINRRV